MIVVDASAVLEVLLQTPAAPPVSRRIFSHGDTVHAPHLLDVEVAQVMRRYVRGGVVSADRGADALADLADLPIQRYPHFIFLRRIWQRRHNLTAYDAAYVVLAEALDAPLVTRDRALARTSARIRVEVL